MRARVNAYLINDGKYNRSTYLASANAGSDVKLNCCSVCVRIGCEKADAEFPSCEVEGSSENDSHGNKSQAFMTSYNSRW